MEKAKELLLEDVLTEYFKAEVKIAKLKATICGLLVLIAALLGIISIGM